MGCMGSEEEKKGWTSYQIPKSYALYLKVYISYGDRRPLGLRPLNVRVGLVRNSDLNGSVSSNTLLTASTSAESYSSDLDTEAVIEAGIIGPLVQLLGNAELGKQPYFI
ncbi:hypothetical protein POM88_050191 [Heracleum sosnowskyi]|uniref:Uncharacterized protein n=1 Tax=Heracleum sosnowskyi TaxID=360622 RepID=A0AAD8GZM8_9APIA|nr:hypothetical protein POM88_050191 [Heracleum sosnowskyi]